MLSCRGTGMLGCARKAVPFDTAMSKRAVKAIGLFIGHETGRHRVLCGVDREPASRALGGAVWLTASEGDRAALPQRQPVMMRRRHPCSAGGFSGEGRGGDA